jgi:hypothetical protein
MSAVEMYDHLSDATPDYNATLPIAPQGVVSEDSSKSQVVHTGVDGSEERISFGSSPIFFITIGWNILSEANAGTIFDWYNDSTKANGMQRSFKYAYGDGHTYVVRFDVKLSRKGPSPSSYGIGGVRLRVLGRIAD